MSGQPKVPTSLPALSSSALDKVKNNDNYIATSVVQYFQYRDALGRIDSSGLRRELRTLAVTNLGIYLEDYHAAGYPLSPSLCDLISKEICATLIPICKFCLSASDTEHEVKSSIESWLDQQRKVARDAKLQAVANQIQDYIGTPSPIEGPPNPPPSAPPLPSPSPRKKAAPNILEPNPSLLDGKETVNRKQAAQALGIVTRTLDRWVADGKVTPTGPGGRKRFKTLDLKRLLNQKLKDK